MLKWPLLWVTTNKKKLKKKKQLQLTANPPKTSDVQNWRVTVNGSLSKN